MTDFKKFGLDEKLMKALDKMGYEKPTPIQEQAIPFALDGRDILGSAQTGTGKTAAFAIPLVQKLLENPRGTALVLTPTRELGKQIMDIMQQLLGRRTSIQTAFLIGGEPIGKQFAELRRRPRLIVGTPGRITDHLDRGTLMLHDTNFLVFDETDRMLDMGFADQLDMIMRYVTGPHQTLMFSATLPKNIMKLSEAYLDNPERVAIGGVHKIADNLKQDVIHLSQKEKYKTLEKELGEREGSVIIFVKTKVSTEKLADKLGKSKFTVRAIHGDMRQSERQRIVRDFRNQKYRVIVATDVLARGLDVPHIEHVINYDLPQAPEDYIHRIGRTARAGAEGSALCLIAPQDKEKWAAIEALLNPERKQEKKPSGGGDNASKKRKRPKRMPGRVFKPKGQKQERGEKKSEGPKDRAQNKKPRNRSADNNQNKTAQERSPRKRNSDNQSGERRSGNSKGRPNQKERSNKKGDHHSPRAERPSKGQDNRQPRRRSDNPNKGRGSSSSKGKSRQS